MTFCAGLAASGLVPVFAVYSSFLQRAFDQIIHDAAIEPQHVVLAVDRAGIVGEDGETHQGIFDVSFLSMVPGIVIDSPCGFWELELCLRRAVKQESGVVAVRYPRGTENTAIPWPEKEYPYFRFGEGADALIVTYGRLSEEAYFARRTLAEAGISVDFLKITRLVPVADEIYEICKQYQHVLFYEEGIRNGGLGQLLLNGLYERGFDGKFQLHAIDGFVPHGKIYELLADLELDRAAMIRDVKMLQ